MQGSLLGGLWEVGRLDDSSLSYIFFKFRWPSIPV